MDKQQILEAIKGHLGQRGIDEEDVKMDASLADDLNLDSLDTVELTLALEQQFEIEIPDSELEDLSTVGDAVDLIESKIAANV
jgi:acyl carrier protein